MKDPLATSSPYPDAKLPPSWTVEPLADGSLRVIQVPSAFDRRQTLLGGCFVVLMLDSFLLILLASSFGFISNKENGNGDVSPWALLLFGSWAVIVTWGFLEAV